MPPTPAAQCPGPSSARGTTGRSSLAPLTAGRTVAKRVGTVHTGSKTVHVFGTVPTGYCLSGSGTAS